MSETQHTQTGKCHCISNKEHNIFHLTANQPNCIKIDHHIPPDKMRDSNNNLHCQNPVKFPRWKIKLPLGHRQNYHGNIPAKSHPRNSIANKQIIRTSQTGKHAIPVPQNLEKQILIPRKNEDQKRLFH